MLLYDDEEDRNSAEIKCINHALGAGQFCVYATVDAHRQDFLDRFGTKISGYKEHVRRDNFLVVDFMPFYESALAGGLDNFNRERIAEGKSAKAPLVADTACNLTRHGQFDECVNLESWWQNAYSEWMRNSMDVTIICAHPAFALAGSAAEKTRTSHEQSLTLDLRDSAGPVSVLIAKQAQDMQTVYKWYLGSQEIKVVTVSSGQECCERAAKEEFDLIIVNTNLRDVEGHEVDDRVLRRRPSQKIVFPRRMTRTTCGQGLASCLVARVTR